MHTAQGHAQVSRVASLISILIILSSMVTSVAPDMSQEKHLQLRELREINLVTSLNLHNTTFAGILQVPGPHSSSPATYFSGNSRAVYYSSHVRDSITSLIKSSKEFSFLTSIRQQRHNAGTIFAFSYGKYQKYRYLEIQSSGRQDVLRLHYSEEARDPRGHVAKGVSNVRVETFPLRLADDSWHKLAVIVSGDQIEVMLDCRSVHKRVVPSIDTSFRVKTQDPSQDISGNTTVWLGQRNQDNFLFKGYLQNTKLIAGRHGYLDQCPESESTCPTCGQYQELEATVSQLQQYIQDLNSRLVKAEARIAELEECDCAKPCVLSNSSVKRHEETWKEGCDTCKCVQGKVTCTQDTCEAVNCSKPDPPQPGSCCPTCRKSCSPLDDLTPALTHGEVFIPAKCHVCTCQDGFVNCTKETCPELTCPEDRRVLEEGKCCKVCRELDYCTSSPPRGPVCHHMAECRNGIFNFSCHCKPGYQGNGTHCDDIDECSHVGGEDGHHCTLEHGRCINLPGTYTCACDDGYKMDSTNTTCLPVDSCLEGQHTCHMNATCLSTGPGTFKCLCNSQFSGDGQFCEPVCEPECDNGGKCISPGKCTCPPGYSGSLCQEDINECDLGEDFHKCGTDSVCVNRVGWYYCACRQGFHSYFNPVSRLTTCHDVDECETQTHTCHSSATCVNSDGKYDCVCDHFLSTCSSDCVIDGKQYSDGSTWIDGCNQCTCSKGRVSCEQVTCDCDTNASDRGCCPQCYDKLLCSHQEISGLHYSSGQRWVYNCMECECLHGEIDCWPQDCPPLLNCRRQITGDGCCPRCEDDCEMSGLNNSSTCNDHGQIRSDGESWKHVDVAQQTSKCTSCQCKSGSIYCNVDHSCDDDGDDRNGLKLQSSDEDTTTQYQHPISESPTSAPVFLEYVRIPESGHDTVSHVSSNTHVTHRIRKHSKKNKMHSRNSEKAFPISNELVDRYISVKNREIDYNEYSDIDNAETFSSAYEQV